MNTSKDQMTTTTTIDKHWILREFFLSIEGIPTSVHRGSDFNVAPAAVARSSTCSIRSSSSPDLQSRSQLTRASGFFNLPKRSSLKIERHLNYLKWKYDLNSEELKSWTIWKWKMLFTRWQMLQWVTMCSKLKVVMKKYSWFHFGDIFTCGLWYKHCSIIIYISSAVSMLFLTILCLPDEV